MEQAARLVAKLPERRRLPVEFLFQSGLRIGEDVGLRWADADLGALRVHVRRSYYRRTMNPRKSRYGVRSVPVSLVSTPAEKPTSLVPDEALNGLVAG